MSRGRARKESSAVGEMPSGTRAVERVLEELPSHPADPDAALAPVFAGTDRTLVSTLTISSKDAGVQGSCGAWFWRRGQHYYEVADSGQEWGLGKQAVSCLAAVRQQNHRFSLLAEPTPPSSVPVISVWAEEV